MSQLVRIVSSALLCGSAAFAPPAHAAPSPEIASAFSIAKSNNKNQVHYAVDVDAACAPSSGAPVHPYWRMYEKSPDATEPLTGREDRVLGVDRQDVDGQTVRVALKGMRARTFTISTTRASDGTCKASTSTTISGVNARVANIYVKMKLFGVDYVELSGYTADGAIVRERLSV